MGRAKKQLKPKEPVTIRYKEGKNGVKSIYLDCYVNGKRWYEFLSKEIGYIQPEIDYNARAHNAEVLQRANAIKMQRISEIYAGKDSVQRTAKNGKMLLQDWMDIYAQKQLENGHKGIRQIAYTKQILLAYAGANARMQDIDKNFCIGFLNFIKHLQVNRTHKAVQDVCGKSVRNGGTPYPQKAGEIERAQQRQIEELQQKQNTLEKEKARLFSKPETAAQWERTKKRLGKIDHTLYDTEKQEHRLKDILLQQRTNDNATATILPTTQHNYYRCFTGALNAAVRAEIISSNPFDKIASVDKIKVPESTREYLTIDEIKKLIATDCKREIIKNAFLFSCFCGLRISDISAITWKQITQDGEQMRLQLQMQKTKEPLYLPISEQAQKFMPNRGTASIDSKIFNLPTGQCCNDNIDKWAKAAGITKKVTFHVARHTFATMMLTLGADLYTTSKLLGHADIETTQIYAKIVNAKKDEAVNLANGIF
ncbi:MAG: site-specific integrase [Clostridia bacterium]|nr:site-specific integrase [Clostridia bacterium]